MIFSARFLASFHSSCFINLSTHIFLLPCFYTTLYLLHRLGYIYMEVQIRCRSFEFRVGGSSCSSSYPHLSSHVLGAATGNVRERPLSQLPTCFVTVKSSCHVTRYYLKGRWLIFWNREQMAKQQPSVQPSQFL